MDRSGGRNFRIAGRRIVALEGAAPKHAGPTIRKLPAGGGCEDWRKKFAKFRIYAVEGLPPQ
jgi:hypothetical protein